MPVKFEECNEEKKDEQSTSQPSLDVRCKFRCKICLKTFKHKDILVVHERIHNGKKHDKKLSKILTIPVKFEECKDDSIEDDVSMMPLDEEEKKEQLHLADPDISKQHIAMIKKDGQSSSQPSETSSTLEFQDETEVEAKNKLRCNICAKTNILNISGILLECFKFQS